nr:MAG TPA: AT hook containing protein [Bacteriophage sp.]
MEEVKRKRGRPRKIKLPEEVQTIIDAVKTAETK